MLKKIIKNIKKTMIVSSAALMLFSPLTEATSLKDYPRVAIMNFGNKAITSKGFRDQDFAMATEYAIYQLSASGWFDLIDYEQLNTIAQMHNINNSGLVDPSTIVAMGQFAGAEYMIVGNVTGLTLKENGVNLQAKGAKAGVGEHVVNANVTVRIVDIKTGRIMGAGMGRGSSTSTNIEIGFIKDKWVERATKRYVNNDVATTVIDEVSNSVKNKTSSDEYNDVHTYDENYGNQGNQNGSSEANFGTSERENAQSGSFNQSSGRYNNEFNAGSDSSSEANANSSASADRNLNDTSSSSNRHGENAHQDFDETSEYNRDINDSSQNSGSASSNRNVDVDRYQGGREIGWNGHLADGSYTYYYPDGNFGGERTFDDADGYSRGHSEVERYDSHENANSSYGNSSNSRYDEDIDSEKHQDSNQTSSGFNDSESSRNMDDSFRAESNSHADASSTNRAFANSNGEHENQASSGSSSSYGNDYNEHSDDKYNDNQSYNENFNSKDNKSGSSSSNRTTTDNNTFNSKVTDTVNGDRTVYTYVKEQDIYSITIGTKQVSEIQVLNAISKAIRDAFYGKTGLLTVLNDGKQLKIKTGF
ncbi:CsgG/HfaB family protein [Anaerovibrio slackiae]|uniref:CsgG/HfaB family protein n=1 Tax=Anaerovibrio slackiae TaxID=2652309 RepID=UPI00386BB3D1